VYYAALYASPTELNAAAWQVAETAFFTTCSGDPDAIT